MTKRTAEQQPDPLRGIVSFKDPLGVRVVDPSAGDSLERLVLCPELTPLETPIRDRVARLSNFRHVRFPRVRGFEVQGTGGDRVATVTFDRTPGTRLSELQRAIDKGALTVDVNAALQVAREALPALAVLHDSRAVAHGAIGLERMVLTPHGRIVLVDHVLAAAIEKLQYPRTRLWKEFRIAVPPSAGLPRFDARSDVAQVALATFLLVLGRPLALKEFPDGLKDLLSGAHERLASGAIRPMTAALRAWFERALPVESRKPFTSALDAQVALEDIVKSAHAYAPTAGVLRVIHDRYVAWEGVQRATGDPGAGRADAAPGPVTHAAPSTGRRPARRSALRVVQQQEDDEADEIRRLEVELERIRKEEALAEQQAVGAESVDFAPPECVDPPEAALAPAGEREDLESTPVRPDELVEDSDAEPDDDSLAIDLDALADGLVPDGAVHAEGGEAEPGWQLNPPPAEVDEIDAPAAALDTRDDSTAALPFDVEPEPVGSPLGRLLAEAAQTTPPLLSTEAIDRLVADLREASAGSQGRQARRRRPARRRQRPAAALPAVTTAVPSGISVPAPRAVEQAAAGARALRLAPAAALDDIVKKEAPAPALAERATPVAAAMTAGPAPNVLELARASAPALDLVAGATSVEAILPAPATALPMQATPVAASIALPAEEGALGRAVRDFTPLRLVTGDDTILSRLARDQAHPATSDDVVTAEETVAAPAEAVDVAAEPAVGVHAVQTETEDPRAIDHVFIDAEAFELPDGVPIAPLAVAFPVATTDVASGVVDLAGEPVPVPLVEEAEASAPAPEPAAADTAPAVFDEPLAESLVGEASAAPVPAAAMTAEPEADVVPEAIAPEPAEMVSPPEVLESAPEPATAGEPVAFEPLVAPEVDAVVLEVATTEAASAEALGVEAMTEVVDLAGEPAPVPLVEEAEASAPAPEPAAADTAPAVFAEPFIESLVGEASAAPAPAPAMTAEPEADVVPEAIAPEPAETVSPPEVLESAPEPATAGEPVAFEPLVAPEVDAVVLEAATTEAASAEALGVEAMTEVVGVAGEAAPVPLVEEAEASAPAPEPAAADTAPAVFAEPFIESLVGEASAAPAPAPAMTAEPEVDVVPEAIAPEPAETVSPPEVLESASEPAAAEEPIALEPLVAPGETHHAEDEGAASRREAKRRRRGRRRSSHAEPPPAALRPSEAPQPVTVGAPTLAPASLPAMPSLPVAAAGDAPVPTGPMTDGTLGATADAGTPDVAFVAPWLRGKTTDAPATAPEEESDERYPVIVNFEAEDGAGPSGPTQSDPNATSTIGQVETADWQTPGGAFASPTVVPFARAVPPQGDEQRTRVRAEHVAVAAPAPSAPVHADRPRVNWRRTAAAALLMVVIEGAAFGAAYWYVRPPQRGYLSVRTSLPGIEVVVDGRPSGKTPASLELTPGRHSIELRGAGVSKVVPVEISAGVETTQSVQWPRSTRVGRLEVKSTPPGARVMIGYEVKGTTPVTIDNVPVGTQEVVVEGDGGSVRSTVKVKADQTAELNVGIYSGWLAVFAPVEVRIFEGGKMIGTTLDGRLMMRPGTHTLDLRNPALGFNETRKVEITPGRVTALSLQAPFGTLTVDAPAGTEIVVDGEARGTAPAAPLKLAVGTRVVVLRHPQLGQRRFVVTMGAKVPVQISFMSPQ